MMSPTTWWLCPQCGRSVTFTEPDPWNHAILECAECGAESYEWDARCGGGGPENEEEFGE